MSEIEELKEHLQKVEAENARLRFMLETIDRDVDRAARRYLRSDIPHGKLKFSSFLELLELEMKRRYMDGRGTPEGFKYYVKETVCTLLEQRVGEAVERLLPRIQRELSEYVRLPVMIGKSYKLGKAAGKLTFAARPLKGNLKYGLGETPEAAYADLRDRLVVLMKTDPKSLLVRDPCAMMSWRKAKPLMVETVEGWTIEARVIE